MSDRELKFKAESQQNLVTSQARFSPDRSQLVLSIFHGVDLFGRGFDEENFCVVRAAEKDLGFDVRNFHPVRHRFDGIIGGSPCQAFSLLNRNRPHDKNLTNCDCLGCEMLENFKRVITEAAPKWFLLENVPTVPNVILPGYKIQRFDLNARECGLQQNRLRHFQFGSIDGRYLIINRDAPVRNVERCVTASEGKKSKIRRSFTNICELQGLPADFDLPYFRLSEKYKVVGQAVPPPMARKIARAIREAMSENFSTATHKVCICGCGRIVEGRAKAAKAACRKRMQIRRERATAESSLRDHA